MKIQLIRDGNKVYPFIMSGDTKKFDALPKREQIELLRQVVLKRAPDLRKSKLMFSRTLGCRCGCSQGFKIVGGVK